MVATPGWICSGKVPSKLFVNTTTGWAKLNSGHKQIRARSRDRVRLLAGIHFSARLRDGIGEDVQENGVLVSWDISDAIRVKAGESS